MELQHARVFEDILAILSVGVAMNAIQITIVEVKKCAKTLNVNNPARNAALALNVFVYLIIVLFANVQRFVYTFNFILSIIY